MLIQHLYPLVFTTVLSSVDQIASVSLFVKWQSNQGKSWVFTELSQVILSDFLISTFHKNQQQQPLIPSNN